MGPGSSRFFAEVSETDEEDLLQYEETVRCRRKDLRGRKTVTGRAERKVERATVTSPRVGSRVQPLPARVSFPRGFALQLVSFHDVPTAAPSSRPTFSTVYTALRRLPGVHVLEDAMDEAETDIGVALSSRQTSSSSLHSTSVIAPSTSNLRLPATSAVTPKRRLSKAQLSPSSPDLTTTSPVHPTRTLSRSQTLPHRSPTSAQAKIPTLEGVTFDPEKLIRMRCWVSALAIGNRHF